MTFAFAIVRSILTVPAVSAALKKLRDDARGQDLVEYALLAGFVATTAGAIFPQITYYIQGYMCYVTFLLVQAASSDGSGVDLSNVPDACIVMAGGGGGGA